MLLKITLHLISCDAKRHLSRLSHCQFQRFNALNVQMLSQSLHKQLFRKQYLKQSEQFSFPDSKSDNVNYFVNNEDIAKIKKIKSHLKKHGLLSTESDKAMSDIELDLPEMFGETIDDHFRHIAKHQTAAYKSMAETLVTSVPPQLPKKWVRQSGWTKYNADGSWEALPFPDHTVFVFDMECLVKEGNYPTMATALSPNNWYSWTASSVIQDKLHWMNEPGLSDLIPLETTDSCACLVENSSERLVIGHHVGFDRSFIKEQYFTEGSKLRFMDTMSMHISICGLTSFQRILYQSSGKYSNRKEVRAHYERRKMFNKISSDAWKKVSSMNNLADVYKLHCDVKTLEKGMRDIFVSGCMEDVRKQFQVLGFDDCTDCVFKSLMTYCANDVLATFHVFSKLWPRFLDRFPHPVTLAGMLEMGTTYLPVDGRWQHYIEQANSVYNECQRELTKLLMSLADQACHYVHEDAYKNDPWLWDLKWKVGKFRLNKKPCSHANKTQEASAHSAENEAASLSDFTVHVKQNEQLNLTDYMEDKKSSDERNEVVWRVTQSADHLPKQVSFMAGYPLWYRNLCPRPDAKNWFPGPTLISTQCRVTPKLMRLTWSGYPLHYSAKFGWGYLVPTISRPAAASDAQCQNDSMSTDIHQFPVGAYMDFMKRSKPELFQPDTSCISTLPHPIKSVVMDPSKYLGPDFDQLVLLTDDTHDWLSDKGVPGTKWPILSKEQADGPHEIGLPGCVFYKIPHKDGSASRVGNPLAKNYLSRVEDGTLLAMTGDHANQVLTLGKLCSYWKNNKDRIQGQMVVWKKNTELSSDIASSADSRMSFSHGQFEHSGQYGAILPRVAVAGTVTRRAVEPTWLTASNAYADRIGSELKSMIHAPPGYHFVGADVDSQELWIAALLGDANYQKVHGCTALGWMTLRGNKADGTDLHSKTAQLADVTRDQAKILNYARIYGAGQAYAEQLLMQFNSRKSQSEVKVTAQKMYRTTKGQRTLDGRWAGGSESFMFNALESVANRRHPATPVLGCRMSKALEPHFVKDDFLTSRLNWVVQSSAVDYLHLMLVCMRWLTETFGMRARFSISVHDEVRFLVASPDRYRAALGLHVANLLTRALFCEMVGMPDLPQSVAFFSAVDIDKCLRKEVTMDCHTPSNRSGLSQGYDIPHGEACDIYTVIQKTGGKLTATQIS